MKNLQGFSAPARVRPVAIRSRTSFFTLVVLVLLILLGFPEDALPQSPYWLHTNGPYGSGIVYEANLHVLTFASDGGIYSYRWQAGGFVETEEMILLKQLDVTIR